MRFSPRQEGTHLLPASTRYGRTGNETLYLAKYRLMAAIGGGMMVVVAFEVSQPLHHEDKQFLVVQAHAIITCCVVPPATWFCCESRA